MKSMLRIFLFCAFTIPAFAAAVNPYDSQIDQQLKLLQDGSENIRSGAAEALGYLRTPKAADALEIALKDSTAKVRCDAAMSLGWCGSRKHIPALLKTLHDPDWTVRQAAWVAITNITGMEWPFDGLANKPERQTQIRKWKDWWATVSHNEIPPEIKDLLKHVINDNLALGCPVKVSSIYKGSADLITDGKIDGDFWQTKDVPFPQSCTIDLGKVQDIGCIEIYQYSQKLSLTEYELSVSLDGREFQKVLRKKENTKQRLVINFPQQKARYVKITSFANNIQIYPTTFFEVKVFAKPLTRDSSLLHIERGLRALGAMGGKGAVDIIIETLKPYKKQIPKTFPQKTMIHAGLRSLGRLGGKQAEEMLIDFLGNPYWARYAADALGDIGGQLACEALLDAYPKYAKNIDGAKPAVVPVDDRPGLEPADRMYETPYAIALALSRMSDLFDNQLHKKLTETAPLLIADLPSDFDGIMIYELQAYQLVYAHLIELSDKRNEIADIAFQILIPEKKPSQNLNKNPLFKLAAQNPGDVPNAATWLPVICRNKEYIPKLIELLEHQNGWVRINAAKTLMFMNAQNAVDPVIRILEESKPEAEYGYNGKFFFKHPQYGYAEYNDTPPRWRQAYVRALGMLKAEKSVPMLIEFLNDDRNVLEVQYAAAESLDQISTPPAIMALKTAESSHPFHSIKMFAREALWRRDISPSGTMDQIIKPMPKTEPVNSSYPVYPPAVVFIKGDNIMPNNFQIDIWRTTYSTTDSGPTYRIGKNLFLLKPARPDGKVTQLTSFKDGYVADCEVSWDGEKIIFARRGGDTDPWWQICEINADGTGLRQLTSGPYHHVQPAYMGDGRIIFSSSRIGTRDEYHGYPATGLTVMNPDGSDIHCIGFNLGRDNEPAVMPDGRIVFSRLELFYSRLKTELTLQSVFPDGTKNITLYGPERRDFWREVTKRSGEKWWVETPPRHRVLRLTQPRYFDDQRIICSTTAGPTLIGPGKLKEKIIRKDQTLAITSPFPLSDGRILCAASKRTFKESEVDLGLYIMDSKTGELTLLYNDPDSAEFEPRPLMPRKAPRSLAAGVSERSNSYTGKFYCRSVFDSRQPQVGLRGKLVRVIEGQPVVARHHTHLSKKGEAWKNHTGTHARVLGTVPLAADGSFFVNVPADRLVHFQVLDSDRRVVGNQQIWMYARPEENRGCVGCHEKPDSTAYMKHGLFPKAAKTTPIDCLPTGGEFSYRAKFWNKGTLNDEGEERNRTVRAVNLIAR